MLALHAATAETCGTFTYLEIGSYLGGSLQAVMRDPRCTRVISIDPRPPLTPDVRSDGWSYENNSTEHMLGLLRELPDVDMSKLTTLDATVGDLQISDLDARPDYCFIDGEHTSEAALRDVYFCAEALRGEGVIAFHDHPLVGRTIGAFLRDNWREISYAIALSTPLDFGLGGGVFALELGDRGILRHAMIDRALGSRWLGAMWKITNRPRRSSAPLLLGLAVMPAIDQFLAHARFGLGEYVRWSRKIRRR